MQKVNAVAMVTSALVFITLLSVSLASFSFGHVVNPTFFFFFLLMCTAACRRVRVCVPEEGAFLAVSVSQWGTCWLQGKLRVLRRLSSVRAGERCQPASRWENQSCCLRLFTLLLLLMIIYSGRNIRPSISDFTSDYYNRRWDDYYDLAVALWLLTILVTDYFIEGIDFCLRIPLYDSQEVPKVDAARFSGFDR